ncbi:MAG: hypothetical protein BTN85_0934 [Candidatus Methanohalarchaeum thermophilum]|uniref:Uncharacterized protein n=1 Tax=Methanohalarchaeum thermophilum TaxID=1903181 RepID=A0A1Q6DVR9_METT1|nr:MAG: hypothetical protein BTN85_0934 [Candidatus Methanohalarchaeum thermophilum]
MKDLKISFSTEKEIVKRASNYDEKLDRYLKAKEVIDKN